MVRWYIYETRQYKHPPLPIHHTTMTVGDPCFTAPLHEILPWHGPTVYVYISTVFISFLVTFSASAVYMSQPCPDTHHLSDISTIISMGSYTLVTVSDLIWLAISDFILLIFSFWIRLFFLIRFDSRLTNLFFIRVTLYESHCSQYFVSDT